MRDHSMQTPLERFFAVTGGFDDVKGCQPMYQSIVPTQPNVSGNLESYWAVQYIPSELAEIYHRRKKMSRLLISSNLPFLHTKGI